MSEFVIGVQLLAQDYCTPDAISFLATSASWIENGLGKARYGCTIPLLGFINYGGKFADTVFYQLGFDRAAILDRLTDPYLKGQSGHTMSDLGSDYWRLPQIAKMIANKRGLDKATEWDLILACDHRLHSPREDFLVKRLIESIHPGLRSDPLFDLLRKIILGEHHVQIVEVTPELLQWLVEDPEHLKSLTPEKFEILVADRLSAMGLEVLRVGSTYRKDGGIDIVAWPKLTKFPFLIAAQVKHHRGKSKTGQGVIRDFRGVLADHPFNAGLLVTNTTFTTDAKWFAEHSPHIVRLRDIQDIGRWIAGNFLHEEEWREIPKEIVVAPGVEVIIPHPSLLYEKRT
jgi:hypothetical protein